ncbi:MAG: 4-hydroxy-3-methylbut-2-enyl diphosphate reductase [Akkermansia sp.]|nr:4-hydroxy-3-methylbut-2-enyl diphosphate reductase [Akkermansia sp.]
MNDKKPRRPVNVRRPEIREQVEKDVGRYSSELVDRIRANGNCLRMENLELYLADAFGFCDGVKRAIEIAYSACRLFPDKRIWLIGEIIHNPEVNAQLDALGMLHLPWNFKDPLYDALGEDDVVIMPAFGVPVPLRELLEERGVQLVDSTCGNVIKVWQRVRTYAAAGVTSVIHGKARHEESMATASQSRGKDGKGNYIVIYNEKEASLVADFICGKLDKATFMEHFSACVSPGFDPELHLQEIGLANQTTMLKSETARIQEMLRAAVVARDGSDARFHVFDTICDATQDRQDALFKLLEQDLDAMMIIGGYNSSNTTHLAQIAHSRVHTYFVKSADCLESVQRIRCYDFEAREETEQPLPAGAADMQRVLKVGITAGASCPANVIGQVIRRLAELRGCNLP